MAKNEAAKGTAKTAITPTRAEDYPEWYQQVVRAADMAENSPVRGCMVIKPWGYAIWENIQRELDTMFKETGHKNAYFPLFIPKSFMEKEAEHVEGFAKECAVVTHHRLVAGPNGGLVPDPEAKLEEPLIVRPTSETIIGAAFAQWVQSYRDLPLLINQWANVVRWEMRTRLFLRTTEFLWQEGHTAHATEAEAREETMKMLGVYATFARDFMAVPVFEGKKTESERFPGAVDTFCIEAMMQDRKALQAGTSHFLGQNFAKASGIRFQTKTETEEFAWTTSWGVSTRLVGAMVMSHADDDGLVLPPRLAPTHVILLPVYRGDETRAQVDAYIDALAAELRGQRLGERRVEVEVDRRDIRGGDKQWEWVKKGAPLRVEIGPRDVEGGMVMVARRDRPVKEKTSLPRGEFVAKVVEILEEMQAGLLARASAFRDEHTHVVEDKAAFEAFFKAKGDKEIHGGFALAHWAGDARVEAELKDRYKVTVRCIPSGGFAGAPWADALVGEGRCIFTGQPSPQRVVFAKSY
ncbi:proline--tRNA ligase [Chondromyces apiculatus]|uniref:Proline--tRNA ligase n=1 Tax=Chondromyces apiculatus DSM 436 TaxID=1192034 RepID=A0A017TH00_9BACT|nr:proline--tRNA ligase [Chondromyces apiculatus]EYF07901.1 Prolyl-tRNA synthetase [Chondromyces apiculatus DSM 436]